MAELVGDVAAYLHAQVFDFVIWKHCCSPLGTSEVTARDPKKHLASRGAGDIRTRWASVSNWHGQHQALARCLCPGGSVLTASSTAQVQKEQPPRPSKRRCFLTEIKLRFSKCILIFGFCGYRQSFFTWSHQLKHASLSRKGFMLKFLASSKRKLVGFMLPQGIKGYLYGT